ncbi:potassium channel subfamily K member 16-like [Pectinophora gossypiella]|uniref:potassium channel subfamily K member 16-like n=1 Tax=Pectinophora gossypiella TaxID=13191 RepID=UPI00214E073D|nr:potassium channel subfamily K member 16-like [Pectinophora gossypiella]
MCSTGGGACGCCCEPRPHCCRCARARRASPLTCLAVCFLVLTYNLLGGFLFLALEGATEAPDSAVAASKPHPLPPPPDLRARTVERLWSITEDLNILYKENWTKLAAKELLEFQQVLMTRLRGAPEPGAAEPEYRWTFSSSFLYALTLITTIGHGNVTPKSAAGKLVAVAYACVGIPIIMLYLSTIGEALARRVRALYSRLPRAAPRRKPGAGGGLGAGGGPGPGAAAPEPPRTPFQAALNLAALGAAPRACRAHTRVPVPLSLLLIALYVALGAAVFRATEDWSLVDGCFFSFSSLATIGFGDLRPGRGAGAASAKAEDVAVGVCCIYILVGIVVIAMCFNLIQEDLSATLRGVAGLCARGAVHDGRAQRHKPPGPAPAPGAAARPQVSFRVDALNPTKFNSLPRRKSSSPSQDAFQRGAPARRSAGAGAGACREYFVPRSLSEFNLSAIAMPLQRLAGGGRVTRVAGRRPADEAAADWSPAAHARLLLLTTGR